MKKVLLAVAVLAIGFFTAYPAQAFGGDREYRSHRPAYSYQHQHRYYHGYQYGHAPRYVHYRESRPVYVYRQEPRPVRVYHESRHHDNTVPVLLGGVAIGTVIGSALH
ncbi:MAG: hypothetical protein A4E65_01884 [Syntrophorhabdus sp. PtaU1.Bin153]|nr:MAG: hypothetical protein A4E65_01884 [Syntrophorhabdus sp. PtaU1.Bin153]